MTTIVRLIGVYDAEGTLRGEAAYWIGARLGRRHCSLCEVTHGLFTEKNEWRSCRDGLPVPFDTYHRDDQPPEIRVISENRAPVVVAETTTGHIVLLDGQRIEEADGDPHQLVELIERAVNERSLLWPA
ncbi:MAG: hypothetical protein O3B66_07515 [Actinomycetota bacterium]|nr:hypothetical protein [Actinomycetota bacterium]MDA3012433.1 hypothetical protein [Actinomycetota bacterium]MDA3025302.1 hypothetical protein [Actinomycetota bacterium]